MHRSIAIVFAALALATLGCSDDDPAGACERIVEACHDKDTGSGEPHDCHEFAEEGATDEQCFDREDDCLESCGG